LRKSMKEIYREMRSRVRVGGDNGSGFLARKVRQRSLLNPMLFNLLLAELEEVIAKKVWEE